MEIDRIAWRQQQPTAFYIGKLQDSLALDPLTAYSTVLVPFFAAHPFARLTLLTKSANVDRLLSLEHSGHSILSWSVNPPEISAAFEENVPSVDERLEAMRRAAAAGYPVRAIIMPIIPVEGWQDLYVAFTRRLLKTVPIQRLTLGGICIYRGARGLMERKLGRRNAISDRLDTTSIAGDGRAAFLAPSASEIYSASSTQRGAFAPSSKSPLPRGAGAMGEHGAGENIGRCNCGL